MKIEDIDELIIEDIKKLLKIKNTKASDIPITEKNAYSCIIFGLTFYGDIHTLWTSNSFSNDHIDDIDNNRIIEIHGLSPDTLLKGPIEFKEIENVYYHLQGVIEGLGIIDGEEKVYFCFNEDIIKYINALNV